MKLTVNTLLESQPALTKLASMDSTKTPSQTVYRAARLVARLTPEIKDAENARVALIKKYGVESTEVEGQWQVTPENIEAYQNELVPLLIEEIEVDVKPLRLSTLDNAGLSVVDFLLLDPFILDDSATDDSTATA